MAPPAPRKPSDGNLYLASCFWNRSRRFSSLASLNSWTKAAAVTKPTVRPFWQAAKPRPRAIWILPGPELPSAMTFSRRSTYSPRASSRTIILFSEAIALKSKLPRLLTAGNLACRIRRSIIRRSRSISSSSLRRTR